MEGLEGANALAKQVLSQLSYTPIECNLNSLRHFQGKRITGRALACQDFVETLSRLSALILVPSLVFLISPQGKNRQRLVTEKLLHGHAASGEGKL